MRRFVMLFAVLVVAAGVLASPAEAGAPPISLPSSPKGLKGPVPLPSTWEPASPYLPQVSCAPVDMTGVKKFRALVLKTYGEGGAGAISHGCNEGLSEHSEGRAWDWMVDVKDTSEKKAAADLLAWLTRDDGRNAKRLGIMYLIYNKKIWAVYRADEGWRTSSGHTDHVHVSFSWNGARGNTSFWTGKVGVTDLGPCVRFTGTYAVLSSEVRTTACPAASGLLKKTSLATRGYGGTGATVKKAQGLLGVKMTAKLDAATWTALKKYQQTHDIPRTGTLDQPTWASLSPDRVTSRVVEIDDPAAAAALGRKDYTTKTIRRGDVGKAAMVLQIALGLPDADRNGFFDTVTLAAVKKVQTDAGLTADGVVSGEEWKAVQDALR